MNHGPQGPCLEVKEVEIQCTNTMYLHSYLKEPLKCCLFLYRAVDRCSVLAFHVTEGSTVILPCHYSVKHHGLSHVCWGRDCGTFWCNDIIVQTDEYGVISKVSDRYRLIGDVLSGQMDLGIQRIQKADSGQYCCRVDIEGYFNDKKVFYTLRVMKGKSYRCFKFGQHLESFIFE